MPTTTCSNEKTKNRCRAPPSQQFAPLSSRSKSRSHPMGRPHIARGVKRLSACRACRACSRKKTKSFCYPCTRLLALSLYCQLYCTIALHLLIKAIPRLASWQRCSGARRARVFVSLSLLPLNPTHVPAYHHLRTHACAKTTPLTTD